MKYQLSGEYETILNHTSIISFSKDYGLKDFDCGIKEYNDFLVHDAEYYIENGISSVQLLIHNDTNAIIGYFALLTDAFLLDKKEKEVLEGKIPFSSVPALKIGKLTTTVNIKNIIMVVFFYHPSDRTHFLKECEERSPMRKEGMNVGWR